MPRQSTRDGRTGRGHGRSRQHAGERPVLPGRHRRRRQRLGGRVPIILTSRADSVLTRRASCAVAVLVAKARREATAKAVV